MTAWLRLQCAILIQFRYEDQPGTHSGQPHPKLCPPYCCTQSLLAIMLRLSKLRILTLSLFQFSKLSNAWIHLGGTSRFACHLAHDTDQLSFFLYALKRSSFELYLACSTALLYTSRNPTVWSALGLQSSRFLSSFKISLARKVGRLRSDKARNHFTKIGFVQLDAFYILIKGSEEFKKSFGFVYLRRSSGTFSRGKTYSTNIPPQSMFIMPIYLRGLS